MSDHWKELAEQLGLPPEQETQKHKEEARETMPDLEETSEYEAVPEPEVKTSESPRVEDDDDLGWNNREPQEFKTKEKEEPAEPQARDDEPEERVFGAGLEIEEEEEEETDAVADEEEKEEDSDNRHRGRRRRGGRGRRRSEGRGEGKRKRDAEPERDESREDDESDSDSDLEQGPSETNEADDEEFEDLSTWVIPSWQELIGSLYRPDR